MTHQAVNTLSLPLQFQNLIYMIPSNRMPFQYLPGPAFIGINSEEVFSWLRGKPTMTFTAQVEEYKQKHA